MLSTLTRPECCPHLAAFGLKPGHGPDVAAGGPGGGTLFGGTLEDLPDGSTWTRSPAGWYVATCGHRPQDLLRLDRHPRVVTWARIDGALPGQGWQVPVLLTPAGEADEHGYVADGYLSALDRIWDGTTYGTPQDLAALQEPLLALANGVSVGGTLEQRNAAMRELAIGLLTLGQWVDGDLLAALGWLSERLQVQAILAAMNRLDAAGDGLVSAGAA